MMTSSALIAGMVGPPELLIILLIVLVLFGGNKIAALGDGLGKGIKNFRRSLKDDEDEQAEVVDAELVTDQSKAEAKAKQLDSDQS